MIGANYSKAARCGHVERHFVIQLAMMISDLQQSPVLDLSSPGQLVDESVNIAGLALQLTIALNDLIGIALLDQFADQWCACGHLLQDGRRTVAAQLSRRQPPFDSSFSAVTP